MALNIVAHLQTESFIGVCLLHQFVLILIPITDLIGLLDLTRLELPLHLVTHASAFQQIVTQVALGDGMADDEEGIEVHKVSLVLECPLGNDLEVAVLVGFRTETQGLVAVLTHLYAEVEIGEDVLD